MSLSKWEEIVKRVPRAGDTHDGLIAHLYERVEELEEQLADVQKLVVMLSEERDKDGDV